MSAATCSAIRADGSPCKAVPTQSGRCFAHDPQLQARTAAARREGGENRSNVARAQKRAPKDLRDVQKRLLGLLQKLEDGEVEPRVATAMASVVGAYIKALEMGEFEARLEALESRAAAQLAPARRW